MLQKGSDIFHFQCVNDVTIYKSCVTLQTIITPTFVLLSNIKREMKKAPVISRSIAVFTMVALIVMLTNCTGKKEKSSFSEAAIDSLRNEIKELTKGNEMIANNLRTFDTLDYTVFTNQEWTRLHESHSKDIKVNWPDGHSTMGIERHIADLKAMFVYAPNTSIKQHPVRFGSNNMTCVLGVMTVTTVKLALMSSI